VDLRRAVSGGRGPGAGWDREDTPGDPRSAGSGASIRVRLLAQPAGRAGARRCVWRRAHDSPAYAVASSRRERQQGPEWADLRAQDLQGWAPDSFSQHQVTKLCGEYLRHSAVRLDEHGRDPRHGVRPSRPTILQSSASPQTYWLTVSVTAPSSAQPLRTTRARTASLASGLSRSGSDRPGLS
jgi:hypothetical protein